MSIILTSIQRRVLGVLIEKSYTTPEQYPLTMNAVVVGCNQKSNRNPVCEFTEGEVADVLQELMHKGVVKRADTQLGARAVRYEHIVGQAWGWAPREQAVLAELMLRGPQTVGELRTRADRMFRMEDLQFVEGILAELGSQDPPLVVTLPRSPGRSVVRHAHTLYPEDEQPADPVPVADERPIPHVSPQPDPQIESRVSGLEQRVAALEDKISGLMG